MDDDTCEQHASTGLKPNAPSVVVLVETGLLAWLTGILLFLLWFSFFTSQMLGFLIY